jgi:ABC-type amino acid transport substrate-binding protein
MRIFAALCCTCLCAAVLAGATDGLARIRARGVLVVSVKNDGNPDRAAHKDPAHFNKRAFELEIAREIARRLLGDPSRVEFRTMPKPARLAALVDGRVDLVISMLAPTADDRQRVDFSRPYFVLGDALMQRGDGPAVRTSADLAGLRVGRIDRNDANPGSARRDATVEPARFVDFESFEDAAAALERGAIDGLLSEAVNIDVWLADHPGRFVRSPTLTSRSVAVALPKGDTALGAEVDAVLDALAASGRLEALQREHGLASRDELSRQSPPAPRP